LLLPLFDRFLRKESVFERVLVAFGRPGSGGAAVHPAAFFTMDRRRSAGAAVPGFGPAARAAQHRSGIARMIVRHALALRLQGVAFRDASPARVWLSCCHFEKATSHGRIFSKDRKRKADGNLLCMGLFLIFGGY
jgi:hypothetical protein